MALDTRKGIQAEKESANQLKPEHKMREYFSDLEALGLMVQKHGQVVWHPSTFLPVRAVTADWIQGIMISKEKVFYLL
jgi:hypothetical protein